MFEILVTFFFQDLFCLLEAAFRIRIHCIWPDPKPDPLQSLLRIRIHFDFFARIRIHLRKH